MWPSRSLKWADGWQISFTCESKATWCLVMQLLTVGWFNCAFQCEIKCFKSATWCSVMRVFQSVRGLLSSFTHVELIICSQLRELPYFDAQWLQVNMKLVSLLFVLLPLICLQKRLRLLFCFCHLVVLFSHCVCYFPLL